MAENYAELKWKLAPPLDQSSAANEETVTSSEFSTNDDKNLGPIATEAPIEFNAERTALLVVDVQPEYWSQCDAVRADFPYFPEGIANTLAECRRKKCKILWVRADYRHSHSPWLKQFSKLHQLGVSNKRRKYHHQTANNEDAISNKSAINPSKNFRAEIPCDPTAPDFTWEKFATPQHDEIIFPKTSWSSTSNAALLDILRASGIQTVLVCGLITSVCVQHSAFGVFEAGYETVLITNGCADRGKARHEAALALYADYMYSTMSSQYLTQCLIPAQPLWMLPSSRDISSVGNNNKPQSTLPKHEIPAEVTASPSTSEKECKERHLLHDDSSIITTEDLNEFL